MKSASVLTALSLPLLFTSCSLINSAVKLPANLIRSAVRTVSDADETTPPATRDLENVSAIALKE